MALDQPTKLHLEKELLPFLTTTARSDVKYFAMKTLMELTGSKDGVNFITEGDKFLKAIIALTDDSDVYKDAIIALINLCADDKAAWKIMNLDNNFVVGLLSKMLETDFDFADQVANLIANITRVPGCANKLGVQILEKDSKVSIDNLINALCKINYNKNAHLHSLGLILSNLSQASNIRKAIMDKDRCIVQKLLPFTEYKESLTRRGGILGTLKNCCFEYDFHPWLLSEEVDILPRLLLPLAGGEEFDDDDMEKLPVDLQYLPPDKQREEDPDLRTMLIEAIYQLCATKQGRLLIKEKNAYVILRELHKWEKDPKAKLVCTTVCELLISDEPSEDMEDLHKVEVPEHLHEKFNEMDKNELNDYMNESNEENK